MLKYAEGLHLNLQTFSDSVQGVMQHLSVSYFVSDIPEKLIFLSWQINYRFILTVFFTSWILFFQSVTGQAVLDKDAVALRHLDRHYGLPEGTLNPKSQLTPTVPIFYLKGCDRGQKYALGLAADLQTRIACCLTIIRQCRKEIFSVRWTRGYNDAGIRFGDKRFSNLPTYKTWVYFHKEKTMTVTDFKLTKDCHCLILS